MPDQGAAEIELLGPRLPGTDQGQSPAETSTFGQELCATLQFGLTMQGSRSGRSHRKSYIGMC